MIICMNILARPLERLFSNITFSPICYAEGARSALSLAGTMLGYYPVRVLPSKTAIAPVNPTFLPRVRNCTFCSNVLGVANACLVLLILKFSPLPLMLV